MDLGNFGCNLVGKKVVPLYVVQFFRILSVFYNIFQSLLVTLSLCHWGGRCVLFFVCCGLGVYEVVLGIARGLVVVVRLELVFSILEYLLMQFVIAVHEDCNFKF
jgi:hypothetical protein